jgi:predicted glutamine amidotransferase
MCRLFGYVTREPITLGKLVPEMIAGLEDISHVHADGWGFSWYDEHDQLQLLKDSDAAFQSQAFMHGVQDIHTNAFIGHLRWATEGFNLCLPNSHPFVYGSSAFAHNGLIEPQHALEELISADYQPALQGTTDSERYFLALLSAIDQADTPVAGIQRLLERLSGSLQVVGANFLFLTPDTLYAVCSYDPASTRSQEEPDYFPLQYRKTPDAVVIASTGLGQGDDWHRLANGQMLLVKRDTLEGTILDLAYKTHLSQQERSPSLLPQAL